MLIKELEKRTGLTRHTIRFYEKQGFLEECSIRREGNNYRDYSEETVAYLMMLKAGQAVGFTLPELKELISAGMANELSPQKKIEILRQKMEEIDRKKAELDQIQMYLAYHLALITLEEDGTVSGESDIMSEVGTDPLTIMWNMCVSRFKKRASLRVAHGKQDKSKSF